MKIAIAASLHKPVSKDSLGGTEMLAHYLVEELVNRGHDVTLYASSDSVTKARLISVCDSKTLQSHDTPQDLSLPYHLLQAQRIIHDSDQYDVIHNNYFETFLFSSFSSFTNKPIVHTMHSDFFHFPLLSSVMQQLDNRSTYVFVSQHGRQAAQGLAQATHVYNGIDYQSFPFESTSEDYFVWLGRLTPKKGAKEAIEAATKAGVRLRVAAAIDSPEKERYYHQEIAPLVTGKITFEGELDSVQKRQLLSHAKALLAPILWEEPFGLVMVEALACGTPVIAYNRAAVPEIVLDGKTGFVVPADDLTAMAEAIQRIDTIDRQACRDHVAAHFSVEKMVDGYEAVYKKITNY